MTELIRHINNAYGLVAISEEVVFSGLVSDIKILNTKNNKFVLKRYSKYIDAKFEQGIYSYLSGKQFRVPKIAKKSNGDIVTKIDNQYYILFEYIKNNGVALADDYIQLYVNFHNLMRKFFPSEERSGWFPLYDCQWVKNIKNNFKFSDLITSLIYYEKRLKKIYVKLPKMIIHGDLKKENTIPNKNGLYLIDFSNARREIRALDIIHLADSVANGSRINLKGMRDILRSLNEKIYLSKEEKSSFTWILIIHKITEYFFYYDKDKYKSDIILEQIYYLINNEKFIII